MPDDPLATAGSASTAVLSGVRRVVMTWKNHLDVGFTASEAKVTHDAVRWLLPTAARLAKRLREDDGVARFTWTVPSWIAWHALEILEEPARSEVETAFAAGDLTWLALPFTMHSELLDSGLAAEALRFSQRLDARFGRRTRCAKQTDVPGHTRGLVGALADAGVDCLHIGVNWMSALPDLPPAFRWRDAQGREVVVVYEGGYGDRILLPGDDSVLLWRMVGDNMEVPSAADVRVDWARAAERFPDAEICAGRMDDWAGTDLRTRAADLPVISAEIGDSWNHGTGTDPRKTQGLRALLRLRKDWATAGRFTPASVGWDRFHEHLLLIAEHTWGVSFANHTGHDTTTWDNAAFARIRGRGAWKVAEASWQEQRDHLDAAVDAVGETALRDEAAAVLADLLPGPRTTRGWTPLSAHGDLVCGPLRLTVDGRGAITGLVASGQDRVAADGVVGLVRYQTFADADCRRFIREYCRIHDDWLLAEFAKRGLEGSAAVSRMWDPALHAVEARDGALRLRLGFPEAAVIHAGAPAEVDLDLIGHADRLELTLTWRNKHPTRLPEALWWTFQPKISDPRSWRLDKLGEAIDPTAVARKGGRWLHGIGEGAVADGGAVALDSPDAHLVAVGEPRLYRFPDEDVDPGGGLHLNLVNNLWGTNFPMWFGEDLRLRATLRWR